MCKRSRTCLPLPPKPMYESEPPKQMGEHPVREDALVHLAHLPGPRDDAAAVDHRSQAERLAILGHQQLCRKLRCAIERAGALQREALGDPCLGDARQRLGLRQLEAGRALDVA